MVNNFALMLPGKPRVREVTDNFPLREMSIGNFMFRTEGIPEISFEEAVKRFQMLPIQYVNDEPNNNKMIKKYYVRRAKGRFCVQWKGFNIAEILNFIADFPGSGPVPNPIEDSTGVLTVLLNGLVRKLSLTDWVVGTTGFENTVDIWPNEGFHDEFIEWDPSIKYERIHPLGEKEYQGLGGDNPGNMGPANCVGGVVDADAIRPVQGFVPTGAGAIMEQLAQNPGLHPAGGIQGGDILRR